MKIRLANNTIPLPKKSHLPDSGLDLFMPEGFEIESLETKTLDLGIAVAIPEGFAGLLCPRSSIAQQGLIIQTSIIDPDYVGNIHLIVTNCSNEKKIINKGHRVCSLVCYSVLNPYLEVVDELPQTERGSQGLGSTGK